jgi:hypothetical protein
MVPFVCDRRAIELYVAAAKSGHAFAQNQLGQLYRRNAIGIANLPEKERLAQVRYNVARGIHYTI